MKLPPLLRGCRSAASIPFDRLNGCGRSDLPDSVGIGLEHEREVPYT